MHWALTLAHKPGHGSLGGAHVPRKLGQLRQRSHCGGRRRIQWDRVRSRLRGFGLGRLLIGGGVIGLVIGILLWLLVVRRVILLV